MDRRNRVAGGAARSRSMIGAGLRCLRAGEFRAARKWFARAAQTEDPVALTDLGTIYDQVLNEVGLAEDCYRRAARFGSITAMSCLGILLREQDRFDEALHWLRCAAASGDVDALHNLGVVLDRQGCWDEAYLCFQHAARAGQPDAMCTVGIHLYLNGRRRQARRWYRRAAAIQDPRGHDPLLMLGALLSRRRPPFALLQDLIRSPRPPAGG